MATTLKITDKEVRELKPKGKRYQKHFGGGFYVYVHPNGRKVCRYHYQVGRKIKRFELGVYEEGSGKLAKLRKIYEQAYSGRKHQGIDPVAEAAKNKSELERELAETKKKEQAEQKRLTMDVAVPLFLKGYKGLRGKVPASRTMEEYANHLKNHIVPRYGDSLIDDLPIDSIMDWLEAMAIDKPVMSNRLFATLSVVCGWRVRSRKLRRNPFAGIEKPGGREVSKNRVLDFNLKHKRFKNNGEIRALWEWCDSINPVHAIALKLILLTGLRPGEVLGLEWADIYKEEIVIPADRTKNKKDILVTPFTPLVARLIATLKETTGDGKFLFPAVQNNQRTGKSVKPPTLSNLILDELDSDALTGKFTPHDLRRTCATHCGDLEFSMADVAMLLNHYDGGVTAIYNRADGAKKKLVMLTAWQNRIDSLIGNHTENNVIPLKGTASS